jgi:hypothetical protein
MIEKLPFFEGFSEPGKAIVNVALLEQWLRENPLFEVMTEQDEIDRKKARDELAAGESLELRKAMDSW